MISKKLMEVDKEKYNCLIKIVKEEGISTDLSGTIETMLFGAKKDGLPFYLPKTIGLLCRVKEENKIPEYLKKAKYEESEIEYIQNILKITKEKIGQETERYNSGLAKIIIENSK